MATLAGNAGQKPADTEHLQGASRQVSIRALLVEHCSTTANSFRKYIRLCSAGHAGQIQPTQSKDQSEKSLRVSLVGALLNHSLAETAELMLHNLLLSQLVRQADAKVLLPQAPQEAANDFSQHSASLYWG
jgi:hypothetical protein